jgi:hypothetical protein
MKSIKKINNMKIFIYKTLFVFILLYIILHLTIGVATRNLQHKYQQIFSKDGIEKTKIKIRKEINNVLDKEKIFTDEDRELIKKIIIKIKKELN